MPNVSRVRRRTAVAAGALGVAVAAGLVVSVGSPAARAAGCSSYDMLMARGTGEPQGDEMVVLGPTASRVQAMVAGGTVYNVVYPASTDYANGPVQGGDDIVKHLSAQAAACPDQKFVLGGYSEGAMAVGQALGRLPAAVQPKVMAIVLFGDPYYRSGQPWDAPGNATGSFSGVAAMTGGGSAYPRYADRIQSYCAPSDMVCGSGSGVTGHVSYGNKAEPAAAFIAGKLTGQVSPASAPAAASPAARPARSSPPTPRARDPFDFRELVRLLVAASASATSS